MKKFIGLFVISVLCCSCFHYTKQEQHGVIVDVEYHEPYTTTRMVPIMIGNMTITQPRVIHHSEYWRAHIHYNDTICVYQDFNYEVYPGDSVSRTVIEHKYEN